MILNLLTVFLILAITAYLANQKFLSASIVLVAAIFGSILAMGLMEFAMPIMIGFRPEYARGVTLLVLFLFAFSGIRIAGDFLVVKNIKMNQWADLAGAGLCGFFAAMTIIGTCLIGIEMLPIGNEILGYDRFPGDNGMQGDKPGQVAAESPIWLSPDHFVQDYIWAGASGRSMGGGASFASVHPNLIVESYGNNSFDVYGGTKVLLPELFSVDGAWLFDRNQNEDKLAIRDVDDISPAPNPAPGHQLVVVRTKILRGAEPKLSSDKDQYLRVTAPQVRAITKQGIQLFPIGQLQVHHVRPAGRPLLEYVSMPLDGGELVSDYRGDKVMTDWVFQAPKDDPPVTIEIKQLARADITYKNSFSALKENEYPPLAYLDKLGGITVKVTLNGQPVQGAKLYLLNNVGKRGDVSGLNFDHLNDVDHKIASRDGEWNVPPGTPGVPNPGFRQWANAANEDENKPNDADILWSRMVKILMVQELTPNGNQNLSHLPDFFESTIVPMISHTKSGRLALIGKDQTDANGAHGFNRIAPGQYSVIVTARTEQFFYFWCEDIEVKEKANELRTFDDKNAFLPIDMSKSAP